MTSFMHLMTASSMLYMQELLNEHAVWILASFPGSCAGEEEREPGTHCSRMRQVPLVTCILLRYTKITVNFCLPPERPHCMVILPVGHIRAILKSKTISL